MTNSDSFGRDLSRWLHEESEHRVPDHLGEILVETAATRQRPAWSSLERWLPMQTTARLAPVSKVAWVLVLLGLLIVVVASAVLIGSRRPPTSPFGAASVGTVVYATSDGDIYARDTATDQATVLIAGPQIDTDPLVSPDGKRMVWTRRETSSAAPIVMLSNVDGSDSKPLLRTITGPIELQWSPASDRLAFAGEIGSSRGLSIIGLNGAIDLIQPEVGPPDIGLVKEVDWLPDGSLVFLAGPMDTVALTSVYGIQADGSDRRELTTLAVLGPTQLAVSPDGKSAAYSVHVDGRDEIHLLDLQSGDDHAIAFDGVVSDQRPQWSPDSQQIVFERYRDSTFRLAVGPVVGGAVVEIGPTQPLQSGGAHARFSPDGTRILAFYGADGSSWVLDPATGTAVQLAGDIVSPLSWQGVPE